MARPGAASLFYASDDALRLYWVSDAGSQHSINIAQSPIVAVTVHESTWDWRAIRGVQIEGTCRKLDSPEEIARSLALYLAKFPFATAFDEQIARSAWFELAPRWIRYIDNSRGFGFREEFTVG